MKFTPATPYLRDRLRRTTYEDIDEFRALLLLERLSFQPLRNWFEEALYVGLRERFPLEAEVLSFEMRFGFAVIEESVLPALRRSSLVLHRLRKQRLAERSEHYRRERAEWFAAGGLP